MPEPFYFVLLITDDLSRPAKGVKRSSDKKLANWMFLIISRGKPIVFELILGTFNGVFDVDIELQISFTEIIN